MIYNILNEVFDFVGVIDKTKYPSYETRDELKDINSIFVVGLAYPHEQLKQQKDQLVASIYTYGYDYHDVMREIINETLKGFEYQVLVDNHELDERTALELTGLAFRGKNDLMINKDYGSYFFIGLVLTKQKYPEVIIENTLSCGDCTRCIKACPVNALLDGFDIKSCMSAANQSKAPLKEEVINNNYLLLGCDICQIVCPFNRFTKESNNEGFNIKPTTYVLINDLFNLSNREFNNKYGKHAYSWRGKTILLRNALTILLRNQNTKYNDLINETINNPKYPSWYKADASIILERLKEYEL